MSDKTSNPKKPARSAKAQPSVLGSLPATRPTRLGRRSATGAATRPSSPEAAKPRAAKSSAASRPAAPKRPPTPPPPEPPRRSGPPSGGELVTTAVQAVGELAQIGLGAGARVLRRAARRLPGS